MPGWYATYTFLYPNAEQTDADVSCVGSLRSLK